MGILGLGLWRLLCGGFRPKEEEKEKNKTEYLIAFDARCTEVNTVIASGVTGGNLRPRTGPHGPGPALDRSSTAERKKVKT